jgi:pimeloyl-ACP methyl ester carboxylesterase
MNWIEVNGTSLRYDTAGNGLPKLVLIHEMGGTLESWDTVIPGVGHARGILRYDTRGAGLSEKITGAVTWTEMAEDLHALLAATGITGRVALAGIAVGAAIAVHFATLHPDRVSALVLHGPATGVAADRRQATLDRADAVEKGGMRAIAEASIAAAYPEAVRFNAEDFRKFRARWLANDPRSFAAINRMLANEDISDELPRIACPTLVTAGRHDALRPPALIEPMARRIPGAEFLALNSGHFASIQTPGLVSQAIHGFLAARAV